MVSKNAREAVGKAKALREKELHSDLLDKNADRQLQEQADAAPKIQMTGNETLYKELLEKTGDLPLTRDPFSYLRITSRTAASIAGPQGLSAILCSKDPSQSLAIINHKLVKKGDKTGHNIVVDIKEDRVILNDGAKDFELKLKK